MTLRTGEDTVNWRRKLQIALCGGIVLEEALDLSFDRLLMMMMMIHHLHIWPQAAQYNLGLYCAACVSNLGLETHDLYPSVKYKCHWTDFYEPQLPRFLETFTDGEKEIYLVLKPKMFYFVIKARHQTRRHCITVKRPDNITRPSVTMSCRLFSSVWILNFHAYSVYYISSPCHPSWFNQSTNTRVQTTKSNLQCYIWIWPTLK